jgi:hypothetical protein
VRRCSGVVTVAPSTPVIVMVDHDVDSPAAAGQFVGESKNRPALRRAKWPIPSSDGKALVSWKLSIVHAKDDRGNTMALHWES